MFLRRSFMMVAHIFRIPLKSSPRDVPEVPPIEIMEYRLLTLGSVWFVWISFSIIEGAGFLLFLLHLLFKVLFRIRKNLDSFLCARERHVERIGRIDLPSLFRRCMPDQRIDRLPLGLIFGEGIGMRDVAVRPWTAFP